MYEFESIFLNHAVYMCVTKKANVLVILIIYFVFVLDIRKNGKGLQKSNRYLQISRESSNL